MVHRTQVVLPDEQYERLRAEMRRTGLTLGELIRRAIDNTYNSARRVEQLLAQGVILTPGRPRTKTKAK